jgi:ketopantoate reductase
MLQDLERGAPTEIEAITGEVVRRARALGVAVPQNRRMLNEVRRAAGPYHA